MKQISQNYKNGAVTLEDVDVPAVKPGTVLVRTAYSVISPGTEGMKVKEAKLGLVGKAKARPDQVKKVLDTVAQQGVKAAYSKVMNRLDSLTPLGYSLSGTVEAVGKGVKNLVVGQKVACAGAGYANHAEFAVVPAMLVTPVPRGVDLQHAAFTTMGSIALHGFRQGDMRVGETAVIIGLGLVGQLLMQIALASGVDVIGIDLDTDKCKRAKKAGALAATSPEDTGLEKLVARHTGRHGADAVFLTVGTTSNTPLEQAIALVRERGRVVCVGKTKMDLPYNDSFAKEVEFRFSRSYGPGRYDPSYEEGGKDYPIGYVRHTEGRNFEAFLRLIARGKINLDAIIDAVHPFKDAVEVYEQMHAGTLEGLGILFAFDKRAKKRATRKHAAPQYKSAKKVTIGCIGAGNYASSMLLPHLKADKRVALAEVATATPLSALSASKKFGFAAQSTDYQAMLKRGDTNAALIATRHKAHAPMVCDALKAGKAVFVEKPLAIDQDGLDAVLKTVKSSKNDRIMVGFNRRYSQIMNELKAFMTPQNSGGPLVMHYRVHAGAIDPGNWVNDMAQGGRFVGEAGHFFDVFAYLTDARPVTVRATHIQSDAAAFDDAQNLVVTVNYDDGSIGNLLYLTQGGVKTPKETLEVLGGGRTAMMENFEELILFDGTKKAKEKVGYKNDKGQKAEMAAFANAVTNGVGMPVSLDSLVDTTRLTFAAVESAQTNQVVVL